MSAYFAMLCWQLRSRKKRVALSTQDEQIHDISSMVVDSAEVELVEIEEEFFTSDEDHPSGGASPATLTV